MIRMNKNTSEVSLMTILNTEAMHKMMEDGPVALFDVRGDREYEQAHIPEAKTAPLGGLYYRVTGVMRKDSFVAVYSDGKNDGLAIEAAKRLEDMGHTNVHCYTEGLKGWRAAGHHAVESLQAKTAARGSVVECRHVIVDREKAYGGAFKDSTTNVESAGG
jgi:rhodanese-related sulfurtransferase